MFLCGPALPPNEPTWQSDMPARDARRLALWPELVKALERLLAGAPEWDRKGYCPVCDEYRPSHTEDCAYVRARDVLKRAKEIGDAD